MTASDTHSFFKSIHRTRDVLSASIHTACRVVAQGIDWKDGRQINEDADFLWRHEKTPNDLKALHVRMATEDYIAAALYKPWPVTKSVIDFWRRLVFRVNLLKDLPNLRR